MIASRSWGKQTFLNENTETTNNKGIETGPNENVKGLCIRKHH